MMKKQIHGKNMKHKLTLHYSVQNGGDGSAYPQFMSSKELAEYDQEHMDEGWGEPCTGSITLESESPILSKEEITTPEGYLINLIDNEQNTDEFTKAFFPNGKPHFEVKAREIKDGYGYNDVFVDEIKVGKVFRAAKECGKVLENILNK
jgi:hypothetical protein